ncbi:tape measure protein [Thauera humireducens]|uniref:tape measure protein n=1 Tax=Thauera humireducens TaxID=1134435 RepID=UPI00311D78F3
MAEDIAVLGIEVQTRGLPETVRDLDRLEAAGGRAERATDGVVGGFRALSGVLAGLGIAATVRQFVQVADEMANMQARIRLVTKSQQEFAHVQAELFRQSQAAQTSLRANADLYVSMARATDGLGVSQNRLLALTDGISKAFVVSGAGAQEMDGAIRQLGQALQSGTLRGDEFNAMAENAPRLMQALADGLGVARGQLRGMAEDGELTTERVLPAIEKGMRGILSEFERMPMTVGRSTQALSNAFAVWASEANQQLGVNAALADGIKLLADNFGAVADVATIAAAAVTSRYVGAIIASAAATVKEVAAKSAAFAAEVAYQQGLARTAALQSQAALSSAAYASAMQRQAAAMQAAAIAQGQMTTAAGLARGALGLLGGPLGALTTALTVGATAWALWGDRAEDATKLAANSARENIQSVIDDLSRLEGGLGGATKRQLDAAIQRAANTLAETSIARDKVQRELASLSIGDESMWSPKQAKYVRDLEMQSQQLLDQERHLQSQIGALRDQSAQVGIDGVRRFTEANAVGAASIIAKQEAVRREFDKMMEAAGGYNPSNPDHVKALDARNAKLKDLERSTKGATKALKEANDVVEDFLLKLDAQEIEKAARAVEEWGQSWEKTLGSLSEQRNALEEQIRYYGMTEAQIAQVTLRRAEEQLQIARGRPGNEAQIALLETEVQLRREIAAAAGTIGAMDANKAAADQAAEDWERASAAIEDALIDSLMEGGKSGAEYIEGLFRTMVLRPIVQAIVSPVAGGITSALGFGAPSASSGGMGGYGSLANTALGPLGGIAGAISGLSSLAAGTSLGSFGAGLASGVASFGSLGSSAATLGAGLSTGGAVGSGMAIGTVLPYVGAALGIANALGAFKGPTYHSGAAVEYGTNNAAAMLSHMQRVGDTRVWGGFSETDAKGGAAYRDPLTALARGVTDTIESALSAFGSGGQVSAYAAFGADGKDASRGSLRIFDALGNLLGANSDQLLRGQKYSKDAQKGFTEFSADAGRVVRDALIAADLPAWVDDILGTIGDGASLDQLSAVIGELSTFAEQATDKTTLWQKATRSLYDEFAALGVEMPQTTAEFNKLIQGSGDLGAELYALAPAFYQLSNVVDEVFASISRTTADSVRDIEMAVLDNAGKYGYLDNEIDRLLEQLNTAYDPTQIQSLFEQINSKTTQAFNLLDEGEQKRLATQFIDRLYEAESLAQSRLSVTPIDYQPQQDAAKAQQAAAEKQAQAADAQIQAANAITSAAGAIASAANRISSNDNSSALAGLTSALSALRPAEVGY